MAQTKQPTGLDLLRVPFPANQVSKLPKPTAKQTADVKADFKAGIRCKICGAWHHKDVVHLDYVGHAALTDRLLDCDPSWNWEPMAFTQAETPMIDGNGGMWIKLTVCGITRLGYGHADGKSGGDAVKEVIGDALRNAAMRFGAALDLWHKGDLHVEEPDAEKEPTSKDATKEPVAYVTPAQIDDITEKAARAKVPAATIAKAFGAAGIDKIAAADFDAVMHKLDLTIAKMPPTKDDLGGDTLPY